MVVSHNVNSQATSGSPSDFILQIVGTGTLTQGQINIAIDRYGTGTALKHLIIAGEFTEVGQEACRSTLFETIVFASNSKVVTIGRFSFIGTPNLVTLVLPPLLEALSDQMVQGCPKLVNFQIPELVRTIAINNVASCPLQHITIPASVTRIDRMFLENSQGLKSIEFAIGSKLTSILVGVDGQILSGSRGVMMVKIERALWTNVVNKNNAFHFNTTTKFEQTIEFHEEPGIYYKRNTFNGDLVKGTGLTFNTTSNTLVGDYSGPIVNCIGDGLVLNRTSLNMMNSAHQSRYGFGIDTLVIDGAYTSVVGNAFQGSLNPNIIFSPNSKVTLFEGGGHFADTPLLLTVVLPPLLKNIPDQCFVRSTTVKSITIGNVLETIHNRAFDGCESLTSIILPPSVTSIGTAVFRSCKKLREIVFPPDLTTKVFSDQDFAETNELETLKLHRDLWLLIEQSIRTTNTNNIDLVVSFSEDPTTFYTTSEFVEGQARTLTAYFITETDNSSIKFVGNGSISSDLINKLRSIQKVTIGKGVTSIPTTGLSTDSLKTVNFEDGNVISTIPKDAFKNCISLENIDLPKGATAAGTGVFSGATGLKSLKMHNKLWDQVKTSLVANTSDISQLIKFYGDDTIVNSLIAQRDLIVGSPDEGYQKIIDYYDDRDMFIVDRSSTEIALTLISGTDVTYSNSTLSGTGIYDGMMTIIGSGTEELTQVRVNVAIAAHTSARYDMGRSLHTLTIGTGFSTMVSPLSLQSTPSITNLNFTSDCAIIKKEGPFELSIDDTNRKSIVLPAWVSRLWGASI
jgi:hypothetical protein